MLFQKQSGLALFALISSEITVNLYERIIELFYGCRCSKIEAFELGGIVL